MCLDKLEAENAKLREKVERIRETFAVSSTDRERALDAEVNSLKLQVEGLQKLKQAAV